MIAEHIIAASRIREEGAVAALQTPLEHPVITVSTHRLVAPGRSERICPHMPGSAAEALWLEGFAGVADNWPAVRSALLKS